MLFFFNLKVMIVMSLAPTNLQGGGGIDFDVSPIWVGVSISVGVSLILSCLHNIL